MLGSGRETGDPGSKHKRTGEELARTLVLSCLDPGSPISGSEHIAIRSKREEQEAAGGRSSQLPSAGPCAL
eukprot:2354812-Pyramimonas_sp.AAC.1